MVNSSAYRPVHLFHQGGGQVSVQYSFDLWAFGCLLFEVLQQHPRLRSADQRLLRLFGGVKMTMDYMLVLRVRNYRLSKFLEQRVLALVVRCQPDRPMSRTMDRQMRAELVRAVVALLDQPCA